MTSTQQQATAFLKQFIHAIDWGGYDYPLPAQQLWNAGVRVLIVKGGQPGTKKLIAAFRAIGFVVGCYYWDDPSVDPETELQFYIGLIDEEQPDFIALDIEQYWKIWKEYNQWLADRTPMTQFFTGREISDHAHYVRNGLKTEFPEKFYMNYSAAWFVISWAKELTTWLYEDPAWYASGFDYGEEWYDITWDYILQTPGEAQPTLPPGAPGWKMWQYSSRMMVPGMQFPFDWNIFDGTLEELKGLPMPPAVFTPYEVETTVNWLTVCMGPGANYEAVNWIPKGTRVTIQEEMAGWGKYAVGWISLAYTKKVDPIVAELTDHEILIKIWAAHPELHTA